MNALPYRLIRANRKTIALRVEDDGNLLVRAPKRCPKYEIDKFVISQRHWIEKRIVALKNFEENHPQGTIAYLGKIYQIIKNETEVKISGDKIYTPSENALQDFLYREAAKVIKPRILHYVNIMGVTPRKAKLSDARTRWGACSSKKNINLSWRLVFCPLPVIDYVVVHELSHLSYMNHSREFWARVEEILPNYKIEQRWLKINGKLLTML